MDKKKKRERINQKILRFHLFKELKKNSARCPVEIAWNERDPSSREARSSYRADVSYFLFHTTTSKGSKRVFKLLRIPVKLKSSCLALLMRLMQGPLDGAGIVITMVLVIGCSLSAVSPLFVGKPQVAGR